MLFCDGGILAIIIAIGWGIFFYKTTKEMNMLTLSSIVVVVLLYFYCIKEEFTYNHLAHGIIAVAIVGVPLVLLISLVIYYCILLYKEEKIRNKEIPLIPKRVEKYIAQNSFTTIECFIDYFNREPEFENARKVQYTNPLYTKQVAENKKREQNKQKPLPITEPSEINYGQFASFKYKEIVLTYFMKELTDVLKNIYMFDYADIYVNMPNYSDFFLNNMLPDAHPIRTQPVYHEYFEDISSQKVADLPDLKSETDIYDELIQKYERIDKVYFQQACIGIINQLIADNIIGRVGSSDLFRSKIIPESNGNIVEGETIEISFDD